MFHRRHIPEHILRGNRGDVRGGSVIVPGTIIYDGGFQMLRMLGTATNAQILLGGVQTISVSGYASDTTLSSVGS